jgi:four helix bundle protein
MHLDDLEVYQLAMELGDKIWFLVDKWDSFEKRTIGKQMVTSADSIGANIAEGYGRFHFGENRQFNFYARGSLAELGAWLKKANTRDLISEDDFKELSEASSLLGRLLNGYIKSIGRGKTSVK